LTKQNKDVSQRIKTKLKELRGASNRRFETRKSKICDDPNLGECLKHSIYWRLRIGKYRAIYKIENSKIIVLFIGHRKNVYDDFSKLL
jgi:Plasmid stabilisation system protein.